jgi:hypothetical protein
MSCSSELNIDPTKIKTAEEETEALKYIHTFMISVPKEKLHEFDIVICNKNYNDITTPENYKGIMCSNYRAVNVKENKLYLRIASIDLDDPTSGDYDFKNFLENKCDNTNPLIQNIIKNKINKNQIIYFKGAYTVYPTEWQSKNLRKSDIAEDKLEIYKNSARAILLHILPYLQKIGIKFIIVDPEPGFHPNTTTMTYEERIVGLIKLYEKMGLKQINCLYRLGGFFALKFGLSDRNVREQTGKCGLEKDTVVMIGDVDDMIKEIEKKKSITTGLFGPFIKLVSDDAKELDSFYDSNVPFKSYTSDNSREMFIGNSLRSILTEKEVDEIKESQTDLKYKQKYLKYKQKYLNLKKN